MDNGQENFIAKIEDNQVQELISTLVKINLSTTITAREFLSVDDDDLTPEDSELIDQAIYLACGCLILTSGQCNWPNHRLLADAGFRVFAGEKDSFGWLIGCIRTKKGIISYG